MPNNINLFKPENTNQKAEDDQKKVDVNELTPSEVQIFRSFYEDYSFNKSLAADVNKGKETVNNIFRHMYLDRFINGDRSETLEIILDNVKYQHIVSTKFKETDAETQKFLEDKGFKDIIETKDSISLNEKILYKKSIAQTGKFKGLDYSQVLSILIQDCNAIAPEDKQELFTVTRSHHYKKDFLDRIDGMVKSNEIDDYNVLESIIFRYGKPQTQLRIKEIEDVD